MLINNTVNRGFKLQRECFKFLFCRANYSKLFLSHYSSNKVETRDMIDKGLRSVAQNDFEDGMTFFQNALKADPHNVTVRI